MSTHVKFFRKIQNLSPEIREALLTLLEEIEQTVTKKEFNELKDVVKELAENVKDLSENFKNFQKETQENFKRVWQAIDELREAQKKTEERLNQLTERINSLTEAQKKTEERLNKLAERVNSLAEAQEKTERRVDILTEKLEKLTERVDALAEAQRKTEERLNKLTARVDSLAEAQKKTEEELKKLVVEHRKTREMVGGLSHTVGYILEDRAYKSLPELIKRDFGISITEPFKRKFIQLAPKKYLEVNIIGKGKKDNKDFIILGECKTQLKKRDVDKFLKNIEKIKNFFPEEKKFIFVTYHTSPDVEKYLKDKNLKLYYSYEFSL